MVEDYVDDKLSPAERQSFEAQMATDPALRAEVEAHREMIRRLDGLRRREKVQVNLAPPPAFRLWWLGVLFVGMTGVVAVVWGARYWKQEQEAPAIQQPEPTTPSELDSIKIIKPLDTEKNIPQTPNTTPPSQIKAPAETTPVAVTEPLGADASLLAVCDASLMRVDPFEATVRSSENIDLRTARTFDAALALLKNHKPAAALDVLNTLTVTPERYQSDREWLEAIAQTMKKPAQGKVLLKRISDDAGHPYRLDAAKILSIKSD